MRLVYLSTRLGVSDPVISGVTWDFSVKINE